MDDNAKLNKTDWKSRGFSQTGERNEEKEQKPLFQAGEKFDALLDELAFNRVLILKNLPKLPQGNDIGKLYYDPVNKKIKIWIGGTAKWGDVVYTTTSTSTTSSSTSSTSTSTTSSSTSTTSTSTS
jgi:hypothetical protein